MIFQVESYLGSKRRIGFVGLVGFSGFGAFTLAFGLGGFRCFRGHFRGNGWSSRLDRFAAQLEDGFLGAELLEGVERRLDDIGGVAGAERLGEEVLDTRRFDHGAHAAAGDEAGSGRSGAQEDASAAELAHDFVGNRVVPERNGFEMFAGRIGGFADGFGDFVGLAETDAYLALAIPDDEERAEAESATAFDDFGASVDEDDFFEQVRLGFVVASAARAAISAGTATTATTASTTLTTARATLIATRSGDDRSSSNSLSRSRCSNINYRLGNRGFFGKFLFDDRIGLGGHRHDN